MRNDPKVVTFERSASYLHHRAMMNRRDNRIIDALELMRSALAAEPDNREYALDLAELYCEMGCHMQSSKLLLDMLAGADAPGECYYGLALNQLGMNDVGGAKQSLSLYRKSDPAGEHIDEVRRMAMELDMAEVLNRPATRRIRRALDLANRGCDAMRTSTPGKACRYFDRALKLAPGQHELRALYAMALMMAGDVENALMQARDACPEGASARALCVSAQVYGMAGDAETARALMDRAEACRPSAPELKMMIYAAGEIGMIDRVAGYAKRALQETPYDRELLHIRATALIQTGADESEAARCWERILRIDPDDTVAEYYRDALMNGTLYGCAPDFAYRVPDEEQTRRMKQLSDTFMGGHDNIEAAWRDDPEFRKLLRWSLSVDDDKLGRASMSALATLETEDAVSVLREAMFAPDVSRENKLHAAVLLKMQGRGFEDILPAPVSAGDALVDTDALLGTMAVGDRQLVRYTNEVLEREYDITALPTLALMWSTYRNLRGMKGDPIKRTEPAAAALAYHFLKSAGDDPDPQTLAKQYGCTQRQLLFCAARIEQALIRVSQ